MSQAPATPTGEARARAHADATAARSLRIAVFASGRGTTLHAILEACARGAIPGEVVLVVCNTPGAGALAWAERAGVPGEVVDHRGFPDRQAFEQRLLDLVERDRVELVCLAGFLRILTPWCVQQWSGRIMNIHPALLPAFGGKGMYGERVHAAVLSHGVKVTGCTVHFVDESPDGGPIILQAPVPVLEDDTPAALADRVLEQEHRLYIEAIRLFAEGRLRRQGRRVQILPATSPDDVKPHVLANL